MGGEKHIKNGGKILSKSKEKISVSFPGKFSEGVTGSMALIEIPKEDKKILMECGLVQENESLLSQYRTNSENFSFKAKDIDYVFAMHCHVDHIGRLPLLVKRGFNGDIIVNEGSRDLIKVMLLDSAKIMARDALDLTKKYGKWFDPIYTEEDVDNTLNRIREFPQNKKIRLDDTIEFEFYGSSHIVKSVQVCLWLKNGSQVRKIAMTSDLGNLSIKQEYVGKFKPIESANLLISECTYNDKNRSRNQKDRDKDLEKIKSAVYNIIEENTRGKVLFPAFSLQRSQSVLSILYDLFYMDEKFKMPIYIASPLTCKISDMWDELLESEEDKEKWEKVKGWSLIHFISDFDTLENYLKVQESAIFIASSGMMTAGYSPYIASKLLPKGNNYIIFIGYSAEGTLSWKIKQKKQKTININGKPIACRCRVINLNSFSSHIQREDLMKYLLGDYSGLYNCSCFYDQIALVHGDKGKIEFGKDLKKNLEKKNKTTKVTAVNRSTVIRL